MTVSIGSRIVNEIRIEIPGVNTNDDYTLATINQLIIYCCHVADQGNRFRPPGQQLLYWRPFGTPTWIIVPNPGDLALQGPRLIDVPGLLHNSTVTAAEAKCIVPGGFGAYVTCGREHDTLNNLTHGAECRNQHTEAQYGLSFIPLTPPGLVMEFRSGWTDSSGVIQFAIHPSRVTAPGGGGGGSVDLLAQDPGNNNGSFTSEVVTIWRRRDFVPPANDATSEHNQLALEFLLLFVPVADLATSSDNTPTLLFNVGFAGNDLATSSENASQLDLTVRFTAFDLSTSSDALVPFQVDPGFAGNDLAEASSEAFLDHEFELLPVVDDSVSSVSPTITLLKNTFVFFTTPGDLSQSSDNQPVLDVVMGSWTTATDVGSKSDEGAGWYSRIFGGSLGAAGLYLKFDAEGPLPAIIDSTIPIFTLIATDQVLQAAAVSQATATLGQSITFPNPLAFVEAQNGIAGFPSATAFSIVFAVHYDSTSGVTRGLFEKQSSYRVTTDTSNRLSFEKWFSPGQTGDKTTLTEGTAPQSGRAVLYCLSYSNSVGMRIYRCDELGIKATTSNGVLTQSTGAVAAHLVIGKTVAGVAFGSGRIDDFVVFNSNFITQNQFDDLAVRWLSSSAEVSLAVFSLNPTADLSTSTEADSILDISGDVTFLADDTATSSEPAVEAARAIRFLADDTATSSEPAAVAAILRVLSPVGDLAQSSEDAFASVLREFAPPANDATSSEAVPTLIIAGEVPLSPTADLSTSSEPAVSNAIAIDLRGSDTATSSEAVQIDIEREFFPPVSDSTSSEPDAIILVFTGFAGSDDSTSSEPDVSAARAIRFLASDLATTSEGAISLLRTIQFFPPDDFSFSSEQAALSRSIVFQATDDAQSSEFATIVTAGQITLSANAPGSDATASSNTPSLLRLREAFPTADDSTSSNDVPIAIRDRGFAPPPSDSVSSEPAIPTGAIVPFTATNDAFSSEGTVISDAFAQTLAATLGGPDHWLTLGEASGTTAFDTGNDGDGDGTLTGATFGDLGVITPLFETSLRFDATGDVVTVSNFAAWETAGVLDSYTIGAWFQIDSFDLIEEQFIFGKLSFGELAISDDGTLTWQRITSAPAIVEISSPPGAIVLGGRYFVVCTFERQVGGGMRLYINGELVASVTTIAPQNAGNFAQPFNVGRDTPVSGENFDGRIQHVFMYEGVRLLPTEVLSLYSAGSGAAGAVQILVEREFVPPPSDSFTSEVPPFFTGGGLRARIRETETVRGNQFCSLEAYLSVLDIWNVALTRLGIERVTATDGSDGSSQALAIAANWLLFKEKFLRDNVWDGAKTTATLTRFQNTVVPGDVVPSARWNYAYNRPADHVLSLRVNGRENAPGAKSAGGFGLWEEETVTNDAGLKKRCVMSDDTPVSLEYLFLVSDNDITLLPADLRWAMAVTLAAHMSSELGSGSTEVDQLEQQAEIARRNARRTDAQTGARLTIYDTTIADAFF